MIDVNLTKEINWWKTKDFIVNLAISSNVLYTENDKIHENEID